MGGYYLMGIRDGRPASLVNAAEDTPRGRSFLKARYDFWKSQKQGWEILFLLHIDGAGNTRPALPGELAWEA